MTQQALDAAYDQAVYAPNMMQVIARMAANSAAARTTLGAPQRFAYGQAPIEQLDIYAGDVPANPTVLFIHGGSWRVGVAADNAFAAPDFVEAGIHFAVPDFSPVDDFGGDIEGMLDQLIRAVEWLHAHAGDFGGNPEQFYLCGFSSGAHLAAVLLTTDWTARGLPPDIFKGALLCSGMYDMTPVARSFRRKFVNLDEHNIPALSPVMNISRISTPLLVAWGTDESPEFIRQGREFAEALAAQGNSVARLVGEGCNHFEIIETLGQAEGLLGQAMLTMILSFAAEAAK